MTKKKFEIGMRVKVIPEIAPERLKNRVGTGTIKDKPPYGMYGVQFDDRPDTIERVASQWLEVLTLNKRKPRSLASTPQDLEKRQSERYHADCFVAIEFHGHRIIGQCVDYSASGFGAIVDRELPIGWEVYVELPLTDRKPLQVHARVVYKKASKYGFEFVAADSNRLALIREFFKENLEDSA